MNFGLFARAGERGGEGYSPEVANDVPMLCGTIFQNLHSLGTALYTRCIRDRGLRRWRNSFLIDSNNAERYRSAVPIV